MPRFEQYPDANLPLQGDELFVISQPDPIVTTDQFGLTKKLTADQLRDFVGTGGFYDIAMGTTGEIQTSIVMLVFAVVRQITLPANLTDSVFTAQVAPSDDTSLTLYKNSTPIGTILWASGQTVAVPTFVSAITFVNGDELRVATPGLSNGLATLALTFASELG